MRVPDYGHGDWTAKYEGNACLPTVSGIGLEDETIFISLSQKADSIKVTGQNHKTLAFVKDCTELRYDLKAEDPYARFTAYFPKGEVIYSNAFARYDSSVSDSPFNEYNHSINIPLSILFNLLLLLVAAGIAILLYMIFKK